MSDLTHERVRPLFVALPFPITTPVGEILRLALRANPFAARAALDATSARLGRTAPVVERVARDDPTDDARHASRPRALDRDGIMNRDWGKIGVRAASPFLPSKSREFGKFKASCAEYCSPSQSRCLRWTGLTARLTAPVFFLSKTSLESLSEPAAKAALSRFPLP